MAGKTVVKGMKKEVIKNALSKAMMAGKTNNITIELPGKGKIVVVVKDDGEISGATLNRKTLPIPELLEIIAKHKITSNTFVARSILPTCRWIINPLTRQRTWVCLPGYVCPPGS